MNERIRELVERAYKEAAALGSQGVIPMSSVREVQLEKFAELLEKEFFSAGYIAGRSDGIRETALECIDIFGRDLPEPGDGRMTEVVDRICRVAEHFAVE